MNQNEIDRIKEEVFEIKELLRNLYDKEKYGSYYLSSTINECKSRLEQLNIQILILDAIENRNEN